MIRECIVGANVLWYWVVYRSRGKSEWSWEIVEVALSKNIIYNRSMHCNTWNAQSLTDSTLDGRWLGSNPILGRRPVSNRKGGCWVAECTWLLYWNSARSSPNAWEVLWMKKKLIPYTLWTGRTLMSNTFSFYFLSLHFLFSYKYLAPL